MIDDDAERALIAGTVQDIEDAIAKLGQDMDSLQFELEEKRKKILEKQARLAEWKSRLAAVGAAVSHSRQARRRKGENYQTVVELLGSLSPGPDGGLSINQLADRTGLPWSSVRAALAQGGSVFVENHGVWTLRRPPKKDENLV